MCAKSNIPLFLLGVADLNPFSEWVEPSSSSTSPLPPSEEEYLPFGRKAFLREANPLALPHRQLHHQGPDGCRGDQAWSHPPSPESFLTIFPSQAIARKIGIILIMCIKTFLSSKTNPFTSSPCPFIATPLTCFPMTRPHSLKLFSRSLLSIGQMSGVTMMAYHTR